MQQELSGIPFNVGFFPPPKYILGRNCLVYQCLTETTFILVNQKTSFLITNTTRSKITIRLIKNCEEKKYTCIYSVLKPNDNINK